MSDWQVTFLATLPDVDVDPEVLPDLVDQLAEHGGAVSAKGRELGVTLTASGDIYADALVDGRRSLERARKAAGCPPLTIVAAEALTVEEADRRLAEPVIPELVGAVEAAEILNVSRQRVHQLAAEHGSFPVPVVVTKTASLWTRASVEAFNRSWTRKPGRPAKAPMTPEETRARVTLAVSRSAASGRFVPSSAASRSGTVRESKGGRGSRARS
jgi:hypothetical protein